ncbi:MAG TPA: IS630 family transposase [Candidatus Acidoferrales bacterium]|nr:IS630 family transposase [Candidatus Acidoferrales bacterium]
MRTIAVKVTATVQEQKELERWVRAQGTPQGVVQRARIVLATLAGINSKEIGRQLRVSQPTIRKWQRRFTQGGLESLTQIAPGRGRKPRYRAAKVAAIVRTTQKQKPAGQTHWSRRTLAAVAGVSASTVHRIWDAHGLAPHRVKTFKLSRDPRFVEKLTDVVGLYLNPPERAIVLCVDEKSQIQALQRTQPGLPLKKGRCGTLTHDYTRHGTTTLFAALDVLEGRVIGQCLPRHRHQEFLKFLRTLDSAFPQDKSLHLIVDNYGTHKHPSVVRWLKNHPRFVLHFTPTSSSWLNLVERWFGELTRKALRRASFVSVPDLIAAIETYLAASNENPKPFTWSATPESILAKISKVKSIYETLH